MSRRSPEEPELVIAALILAAFVLDQLRTFWRRLIA